jgi:hypothetical protein
MGGRENVFVFREENKDRLAASRDVLPACQTSSDAPEETKAS